MSYSGPGYYILTYTVPSINIYNTIVITSLVSYLQIRSVYTLDYQNNKIPLISGPITFGNLYDKIGATFSTIQSSTIYFDVYLTSNVLLADLISVRLTNTSYVDSGSYISPVNKITAGNNIQPVIEFASVDGIYVDCTLNLRLFDVYGNIRVQEIFPLAVNSNGTIVQKLNVQSTGFNIPLPISSVSNLQIYYQHISTQPYIQIDPSNYTLTGTNTINFDSRNLQSFIIIYTPAYYLASGFTQIAQNLFINNNNILQHNIKDVASLDYRYTIHMYNFNTTSIDQTVVLKRLGIVSY